MMRASASGEAEGVAGDDDDGEAEAGDEAASAEAGDDDAALASIALPLARPGSMVQSDAGRASLEVKRDEEGEEEE